MAYSQVQLKALGNIVAGGAKKSPDEALSRYETRLEEYRDERIPLSVHLHLLKTWSVRLENGYLLAQTLLGPYPLELVKVSDSGKGRDY